MRKILSLLLLMTAIWLPTKANDFANENIKYKVEYKWGLINKTAGYLNVRLDNKGDKYACNLAGSTAPWADKVYKVRDTLTCEIKKQGFVPLKYEKRAHEDNDDSVEKVIYRYQGNTVYGDVTRKKWKKGKSTRDETLTLQAEGFTLDMLSAFFYMRNLPYDTWAVGQQQKTNIFSGKQKETLTIKYQGRKQIEIDKVSYDCYHIKFSFTSKGGKKSSDDIEAWIDTSGNHIPVKLEGSLPIGKIRCFYMPK